MCFSRETPPTPPYRHLVAIGDLRGDFNHTLILLCVAGIIGAHGAWVAGTDTVVQVGDVLDRGTEPKLIVDLIRNLTTQASNAGGQFVGGGEEKTSSTRTGGGGDHYTKRGMKPGGKDEKKHAQGAPVCSQLRCSSFVHPHRGQRFVCIV